MTGRALIAALIALALALGGCAGVAPPQAPLHYAAKLGVATSDISTACGEAYQLTAFPPPPKQKIETLEATASAAARRLAEVYHRNRRWIYEGASVATIVRQADAMLSGCGLKQADAVLRHAVRQPSR